MRIERRSGRLNRLFAAIKLRGFEIRLMPSSSDISIRTAFRRRLLAEIGSAVPCRPIEALAKLVGSSAFLVAAVVGFVLGFLMIPLTGERAGALIAFGALCIAAWNARWALAAQNIVERLQEKLFDEASYHAFVDSAAEGFFPDDQRRPLSDRQSRSGAHLWL
jgi:hypothetical protein